MQNPSTTTRLVLRINAAFSTLVGLDLIFLNTAFMRWMDISNEMILPIIGLGLIPFGLFVFWVAFQRPLNLSILKSIIIMDASWVLGCVLVVAMNIFGLSMLGNVLVLASALIVGSFAYFQFRGWQQLAAFTD